MSHAEPQSCSAASAGLDGCITCGDVAVDLTVIRYDDARELALCEDAEGRRESVETALVGEVEAGERLLVHAGTAIARSATEVAA